jgi:hypothetical protein
MPKPSPKPQPDARAKKAAQRIDLEADAAAADALRTRAAWHSQRAAQLSAAEQEHHRAVAARLTQNAEEFDA